MKLIQAVLLLNVAALILCGTYPLGLRSTFSDGNVMYSILGGHINKFNLKTLAPMGQVALSENREYAPQKALFHPTDSNVVYLYSATSIDKINLSTGVITDSARAIDGFSFNGCDIDTTGLYVGYASTTAVILTRYSLSTGASSTLSFPLTATEQAMFVGVSGGIGYVAITSTSDSTLVIQRVNLATFTVLGSLSINYLYESWQITNAYAVADGIALFDGYNLVASKYKIDNTKNTISLVGTLNTNTVIQVPLQDNKNKFIFATGAECQADRNGGSCAQVMNRIIDFTNAPVFVGAAVALPASSTSWVKSTPSGWNTNGAYTFGVSNGVVFYPVLTNNELTSVRNYIIATGATNEKAVTILAPCWTCSPGYSHWYDLGWNQPSNGDRCQCVYVDCWTCAPGWTHWYDLKWQQPSNGDRCQCVRTA